MKLGIIVEGQLQNKKIILEPRTSMKQNEYLVEKGIFLNGSPMFQKACLICEKFIGQQCPKCN